MRWLVMTILMWPWVAAAYPLDGCPPFRSPSAETFGVAPDPDALLGAASAGWAVSLQQLRSANHEPLEDRWLVVQHASAQAHVAGGLALTAGWTIVSSESPALRGPGNVTAGIGYRRSWLALGDTVRGGVALHLGDGLATGGADQRATSQRLAERLPFHEAELAPGHPLAAELEVRFELVGCHVPFAHLRLGIARWHATGDPVAHSAPLSLTAGWYQRSWIGFAMSVAVDLRTPRELFAAQRLTRVSVLVDLRACRWFHVVVHGDAISGGSTGVELGAAVAITFLGGA